MKTSMTLNKHLTLLLYLLRRCSLLDRIPTRPWYYSLYTNCVEISFWQDGVKCKHLGLPTSQSLVFATFQACAVSKQLAADPRSKARPGCQQRNTVCLRQQPCCQIFQYLSHCRLSDTSTPRARFVWGNNFEMTSLNLQPHEAWMLPPGSNPVNKRCHL